MHVHAQRMQHWSISHKAMVHTIPTLAPGWYSVPLCRTMILPGMQCCPPYILIPSIFGLESLVFWVEPPCFFEALCQGANNYLLEQTTDQAPYDREYMVTRTI